MQSLSNDGAQQNLVALAVQLRLARQLLGRDSALVRSVFDDLDRQTKDALGTLRDLARGIFPPMLADRGLVGALKAHILRACPAVRLEALQNSSKHAADAPLVDGATHGSLSPLAGSNERIEPDENSIYVPSVCTFNQSSG